MADSAGALSPAFGAQLRTDIAVMKALSLFAAIACFISQVSSQTVPIFGQCGGTGW